MISFCFWRNRMRRRRRRRRRWFLFPAERTFPPPLSPLAKFGTKEEGGMHGINNKTGGGGEGWRKNSF